VLLRDWNLLNECTVLVLHCEAVSLLSKDGHTVLEFVEDDIVIDQALCLRVITLVQPAKRAV
jgi:hypothetical protein